MYEFKSNWTITVLSVSNWRYHKNVIFKFYSELWVYENTPTFSWRPLMVNFYSNLEPFFCTLTKTDLHLKLPKNLLYILIMATSNLTVLYWFNTFYPLLLLKVKFLEKTFKLGKMAVLRSSPVGHVGFISHKHNVEE